MIKRIGQAMRRTKSLCSIHLCQNPGATDRVRDYLRELIRCKPEEPYKQIKISEVLNRLNDITSKEVLKRQLARAEEAEGEKPVARETIKIKQIMERKRQTSLVNEFTTDYDNGQRLILTRVLGHKMDMPGSGQWKLIKDKTDDCWICD